MLTLGTRDLIGLRIGYLPYPSVGIPMNRLAFRDCFH